LPDRQSVPVGDVGRKRTTRPAQSGERAAINAAGAACSFRCRPPLNDAASSAPVRIEALAGGS